MLEVSGGSSPLGPTVRYSAALALALKEVAPLTERGRGKSRGVPRCDPEGRVVHLPPLPLSARLAGLAGEGMSVAEAAARGLAVLGAIQPPHPGKSAAELTPGGAAGARGGSVKAVRPKPTAGLDASPGSAALPSGRPGASGAAAVAAAGPRNGADSPGDDVAYWIGGPKDGRYAARLARFLFGHRRGEHDPGTVGKALNGEDLPRRKVEAMHFEAPLCSFQDLVNEESHPVTMAEMFDRLRDVSTGPNFLWDRAAACVTFTFQLIIWFPAADHEDTKTSVSTTVSFLHQKGCAYVFQPVVPLTSLIITPRPSFRPMFERDPRSFHTFKVVLRKYLEFGSGDYRTMVGEQLEKWTSRCRSIIEKPLDATYWLMLMIGSHYREILVERGVVKGVQQVAEKTPVLCIDSLTCLLALLFSSERQILFAGIDPDPAYCSWLRYIGNQFIGRKSPKERRKPSTQFETNEFLDLAAIVVYYSNGNKARKAKEKEADPLAWVGNPSLVRTFMTRYVEDNRCSCQLEHAARLYSQSCALGRLGPQESWYCWNGLEVCELGVPMPCTQATFLSPFVTTKQVALMCPLHGVEIAPTKEKSVPKEEKGSRRNRRRQSVASNGSNTGSPSGTSTTIFSSSMTTTGSQHRAGSRGSLTSDMYNNTDGSSEDDLDRTDSFQSQSGDERELRRCACRRYMRNVSNEQQGKAQAGRTQVQAGAETETMLQAVGDFEIMHSFAAVLAGGLNLAKQVLRLHFSIDPQAYENLPGPSKNSWREGVMPWYRELHRPDAHGRSRYGILLERVLRGLLGNGYTAGLLTDALDTLRVRPPELKEEAPTASMPLMSKAAEVAARFARGSSMPGGAASALSSYNRAAAGLPSGKDIGKLDEDPMSPTVTSGGDGGKVTAVASEKAGRGILEDIAFWVELCESDSILNHKAHFESFHQWCHSANLVPFMQRAYRRLGVAGLAVSQRMGRYKHGADPSHPLVLPTMPDFCYGHCYPFHRVLQYFYAGMERITCSIDDPREVDADRGSLGLIAGQERLNNQCWFQAVQVPEGAMTAARTAQDPALSALMPQLTAALGAHRTSTLAPGFVRRNSNASMGPGAPTRLASKLRRRPLLGGVSVASFGGRTAAGSRSGSPHGASRLPPRPPPAAGELVPEDPFFWFCQKNFALYTYPASIMPRHYFNDINILGARYTDFVSRTGTPEPSRTRGSVSTLLDMDASVSTPSKAVPPSICLSQPTELGAHVRYRWEVNKTLVDEKGLILGDTGFFPGAYGHRFTFEVKSDNVDHFVRTSVVPEAQLLYLQFVKRSKHDRMQVHDGHARWGDSSSSSDQELSRRVRARPHGGRAVVRRRGNRRDEEIAHMLPAVLPVGSSGASPATPVRPLST